VRSLDGPGPQTADARDDNLHELEIARGDLELALEAGQVATWSWEPGATEPRRSPSFERLLGLEPGTTTGFLRTFMARLHPDDRSRMMEAIGAAGERAELALPAFRLVTPDGGARWIELRGRKTHPGDRHSPWTGVGVDVTLHAAERERLAQTLAHFRTLTSHAPVGFAILDTDLRFVAVSEAFSAMNGASVEEHLGRSPGEVVPDIWPSVEPQVRAVLDMGTPVVDHEITGLTPAVPGAERTWLESFYPVDDTDGSRLGVGLFVVEITERKRAERLGALVANVSRLFGVSMPRSALLDRLVRIPLPDFAHGCVLRLRGRPSTAGGVAVAHTDPELEQPLRTFLSSFDLESDPGIPAAAAQRTGSTVRVRDIETEGSDLTRDVATRATLAGLDVGSLISVPLMVADRTLGVMTFFRSRSSGVQYQADEEAIAEGLALRVARVVENARVAEEAEQARKLLGGLSELGSLLAVELDSRSRLDAVARAVVPTFGDTCAVYLVDAGGALEVSAFAHVDEAQQTRVGDLEGWPSVGANSNAPMAESFRNNAPVLLTRVPVRHATMAFDPDDARDLVFDMDVHSLLCVPLPGITGPIGVLALGYVTPDRFYREYDIAIADDIARRVGPAIANALRFEHERGVAEILQRTLLPQVLPAVRGVDLAARYFAGGPGLQVGGDWYDVLPLPDGRFMLAIGDVVGHGVRAATAMGRLRSVLQFCARTAGPARILQLLDEHFSADPEGEMVTLLLIRCDPSTGRVEVATAGHPPAMVWDPDGTVRPLEGGRGVPLCTVPNAVFEEMEAQLVPGSTLLMYTDGLIERRGESLDSGFGRLAQAMAAAPADLDAAMDSIAETMRGDGALHDDIALLALRIRDANDLDLHLCARPRELRSLRSSTREWVMERGGSRIDAEEVSLAVSEAAANTIEHAYRHKEQEIVVHGAEHDGVVEMLIRDFGEWREPRDRPGRGLALARALMDAVDIDTTAGGTEVRIRRRFRDRPEPGSGGRAGS
jgi:PAS domain S-box-containing protein